MSAAKGVTKNAQGRLKLTRLCGHEETIIVVPPKHTIELLGEKEAYASAVEKERIEGPNAYCEECEPIH